MNTNTQEVPQAVNSPAGGWPSFAGRLAVALSALKEKQYLVLALEHGNRFVQFAGQGASGLRAEAVSNAYLAEDDQLDEGQIARLEAAGWRAPTHRDDAGPQERDPTGSPNFFADFEAPVAVQQVAEFAVRTLAEIFDAPGPDELEYDAFERGGRAVSFPGLCSRRGERCQRSPEPEVPPGKALLAALRRITGLDDLEFDADADIGLRRASQVIFVRLLQESQVVRIWSPLLRSVEESFALLARLNRLNTGPSPVRFCVDEGVIFAEADADANPLLPQQIASLLRRFSAATDGVDVLLQREFGGLTAVAGSEPRTLLH